MQPPLKLEPSSMSPAMTQIADGQRRRTRLLIAGVHEVTPLLTSSSSSSSSSPILPSNTNVSSPVISHSWRYWKPAGRTTIRLIAAAAASIFLSLLPTIHSLVIPPCRLTAAIQSSSGRSRKAMITGTFFGPRRGRVCFAVQPDPRSDPVLLLDLAIPTSHLVKEMASGMVRILLDCEQGVTEVGGGKKKRLLREEPRWTVYCNGQKRGYAAARACGDAEFRVLRAVQAVSVGAGVLPAAASPPALPALERTESLKGEGRVVGGGDVMYMRARFERVVGGKDSEAFYMINPDSSARNNGAPELSIFLLRK